MKEASLETFIKTILERDSEKLEDITLSCDFWPQVGAAMAITVAFVLILEACLYCVYCKFCRKAE
jgi:hypothetical protein